MTAADRAAWLQTPAGRHRQALGATEVVDYDAAERLIAEVRAQYRRERGRELYDEEADTLRRQAELRSIVATAATSPPQTAAGLHSMFGYGVSVDPGVQRDPDGMLPGSAKFEHGRWVGPGAEAITRANQEREAQIAVGASYADHGVVITAFGPGDD